MVKVHGAGLEQTTVNLMTVAEASKLSGKSERSVWRYAQQIEKEGRSVVYRVPGVSKTYVDFDVLGPVAAKQKRGGDRTRREKPT